MRIDEIASPSSYFHVTTHRLTPKLLAKGILPNMRRQWKNTWGSMQGERGKIYLFDTFTMAIKWAANMEWHKKQPIDILVVKVSSELELDPHVEAQMNQHYGKWYTTSEAVPPQNIVRVIPLTLELKREFVAKQNVNIGEPVELPPETSPATTAALPRKG